MTIIVGTGGGAFANKNCPQGRVFEQFFQMPGGGMLAAGIDSHINVRDHVARFQIIVMYEVSHLSVSIVEANV